MISGTPLTHTARPMRFREVYCLSLMAFAGLMVTAGALLCYSLGIDGPLCLGVALLEVITLAAVSFILRGPSFAAYIILAAVSGSAVAQVACAIYPAQVIRVAMFLHQKGISDCTGQSPKGAGSSLKRCFLFDDYDDSNGRAIYVSSRSECNFTGGELKQTDDHQPRGRLLIYLMRSVYVSKVVPGVCLIDFHLKSEGNYKVGRII